MQYMKRTPSSLAKTRKRYGCLYLFSTELVQEFFKKLSRTRFSNYSTL